MPPYADNMIVLPIDDSKRIVLSRELVGVDNIKRQSRICTKPTKQVNPSGQDKSKKKKKKVNFLSKIKVRTIPARRHYTKEEFASTWYSKAEFKSIRETAIDTVRMMVQGNNPDDHVGYCSRGLEFKVPTAGKERQSLKRIAIRAVMEEQECQLMTDGKRNDEYLRSVYGGHCSDSTSAAFRRGAEDELEAKRIYRADERKCRRSKAS